jgi:hypothetical protein
MQARVNNDSKFLVANTDHKNFTETDEIIEEGSIINGNPKNIEGLRRGEPFTYRLFILDNDKILYLNNITPMNQTEVTLGADSQQSATTVNLLPAETFNRTNTMGIVIGGLAGFAFAKYKKHDMKKVAMYIAVGAIAGYFGGYVFDRSKKIQITQSK